MLERSRRLSFLFPIATVLAACAVDGPVDSAGDPADADQAIVASAHCSPVGGASAFAQTPPNQYTEGVAVRGNRAYVSAMGAFVGDMSGDGQISRIFVYDRTSGAKLDEIPVQGEDTARWRGLAGMAFDGFGRLYAVDVQGRILRFNVASHAQETYATIPTLPACTGVAAGVPCSAAGAPLPNDLAFDEQGNLYVTDSFQAAIFRIRPAWGARTAEVWFQDPRLESPLLGANGIRVSPDGSRVYFGVMVTPTSETVVYHLPRVARPRASDLVEIRRWPISGFEGMNGLAFDTKGRLYVSIMGGEDRDRIEVLDRNTGASVRTIRSPLLDEPAVMAFDDASGSLLVARHNDTPDSAAPVVRVCVDARGARLAQPILP